MPAEEAQWLLKKEHLEPEDRSTLAAALGERIRVKREKQTIDGWSDG
ncbi:MAG: hypothetical protein WAN46_13255 [Gammaproteobacteria bacterium]